LLPVMMSTDGIVIIVVVDVIATVIFSAAECTRPKQFEFVDHFSATTVMPLSHFLQLFFSSRWDTCECLSVVPLLFLYFKFACYRALS
jgi:hypothetical protein